MTHRLRHNYLRGVVALLVAMGSCMILSPEISTAQAGNSAGSSTRAGPARGSSQAVSIQLMHAQVTEKNLPNPGSPLTLRVEVLGARETNLPIRLIAVRDGKITPVPLSQSSRNAVDRPTYDFVLPSPLVELSYQFILPLTGSPGTVISSERFSVRRSCVPAFKLAKGVGTELEQLAASAKLLEGEIEAYNSALSLAEKLSKEVAQ